MAYGLEVRGLPDDAPLLTARPGAPVLAITQAAISAPTVPNVVIDGARYRAPLLGGRRDRA
jgi:hypothetical protein